MTFSSLCENICHSPFETSRANFSSCSPSIGFAAMMVSVYSVAASSCGLDSAMMSFINAVSCRALTSSSSARFERTEVTKATAAREPLLNLCTVVHFVVKDEAL